MGKTKIAWTQETWNPVRGCTPISAGCAHCYARTFAERWRGVAGHPYEQGFDLRLVPEKLHDPLGWRKPRRVFVNSMSDLFQENVPASFIDQVFAVMAMAPQHTFQILTKRPERMQSYLTSPATPERILAIENLWRDGIDRVRWPLPNVWLGVSAENQDAANSRIPILLDTPAAVRWISAEPLLGPINLKPVVWLWPTSRDPLVKQGTPALDWVVVGGESGPGARPMHPDWAKSLRDQCQAAGVPFFFKAWGEWYPAVFCSGGDICFPSDEHDISVGGQFPDDPDMRMCRTSRYVPEEDRRLLDGQEWNEYPEARP